MPLAARKDRGQFRSVHVEAAPSRILTGKREGERERERRRRRGGKSAIRSTCNCFQQAKQNKNPPKNRSMPVIGEIWTALPLLNGMGRFAFRARTSRNHWPAKLSRPGIPRSCSNRSYSRLPFSPCSVTLAHHARCSRIFDHLVEPAHPGRCRPRIIADDRCPGQGCRVSTRYFRVLDSLRPGASSRWGRPTAESNGEAEG